MQKEHTAGQKLYLDETGLTECLGIMVKGHEVIPAGTTLYAMPVSQKSEGYARFEELYDIHFFFAGEAPAVDFYAVPRLDLFARDSRGGLFGTLGGGATGLENESPICYLDSERRCFLAAECLEALLSRPEGWQERLVPCQELITLYPSLEEAKRCLDFLDAEQLPPAREAQ